jgi:EmrB/QacA subfamily drug resistance transporter
VSTSQKRLTLIAAILGSSVVLVDSTAVNVALPAIQEELGGGLAAQEWLVNAYLLTLGSLILIGGSMGDLFGERRVFFLGVAGFGAASVVCALAPTIGVEIAGRALQGVAGALLTPSSLAVIIAVFPEGERSAAIGTWTAWGAIGTVLGPLLGGQLVDAASWRWIFAINVPLVLATLWLIAAAIPRTDPNRPHAPVDYLGAFLCAVGLGGFVFALIEQPQLGWGSPAVVGPLIGGIAVLALFLWVESRKDEPMLPLGLFRRRNFAWGNAETLAMYGGLGALLFFLVLFLQQVAGYTALESGLTLLPVTIVMFLLSKRFGALADRYGPRFFMGAGPLVGAVGLLLLFRLDTNVDYVADLLPALLLFALGLALTVAPLTAAVLAGADESNAGIASATNNAVARIAGLIATAAVGAAVAGQFTASLDRELAGRQLSPPARAAVEEAKDRSLTRVPVTRVPPSERPLLEAAAETASLRAFRTGIGISAALLALGGLMGTVGIRDPRRLVPAEQCPGGAICGAPRDPALSRMRHPLRAAHAAVGRRTQGEAAPSGET